MRPPVAGARPQMRHPVTIWTQGLVCYPSQPGFFERATLMTRSVPFALSAAVAAGLALGLLAAPAPGLAQMSDSDLVVKLEQLQSDVRRLTGAVEELQYKNQQLEQALRALQGGGAQGGATMRPGPA